MAQLVSLETHVRQIGVGEGFGLGAHPPVGLELPAAGQPLEQAPRETAHERAASRARRGMSAREMPRSASSRLVRLSSSWSVRQ